MLAYEIVRETAQCHIRVRHLFSILTEDAHKTASGGENVGESVPDAKVTNAFAQPRERGALSNN